MNVFRIIKLTLLFLLIAFVCFLFCKEQSFPGEEDEPLYRYSWPEKLNICEIDGKRIYENSDSLNISLFQLLFLGSRDVFYSHHLFYKNAKGEKINFLTYRTPFVWGIDVVPENIRLAIENEKEKIVISYDREPIGGISIDSNPFSKKIELRLESDWDGKMRKDGLCK